MLVLLLRLLPLSKLLLLLLQVRLVICVHRIVLRLLNLQRSCVVKRAAHNGLMWVLRRIAMLALFVLQLGKLLLDMLRRQLIGRGCRVRIDSM